MEEKSMIEIKRDEIGIIPNNDKELILDEIKNIIKMTDMSNLENRKKFDSIIKSNKQLMDMISGVSFFSLVIKIANECGDFHTREYLLDKYKNAFKDLFAVADEFVPGTESSLTVTEQAIYKYFNFDLEQWTFTKFEKYLDVLMSEVQRLEEIVDDLEYEDKYDEADKYSERADKLSENFGDIESFAYDTSMYSDEFDACVDKLQKFIIYNADLYVNSNELFDRLVKELDGVSLEVKRMYLNTIMEYTKKYQAKYRTNDLEQTNEENLEIGKRVK